jgi:hypothetical protein
VYACDDTSFLLPLTANFLIPQWYIVVVLMIYMVMGGGGSGGEQGKTAEVPAAAPVTK